MTIEGTTSEDGMLKLRAVVGPICNVLVKRNGLPLSIQRLGIRNVASQATSATQTKVDLPQLPVPPLKDTLAKYITSVQPLVTESEFAITKNLVADFGAQGGIGEKLQRLLQKRAERNENWLSDWWLNSAYLEFRWPVVVYSSPGLVFPLQKFKSQSEQLEYASKMIAGALDYKLLIDTNQIPAESMGKDPLDMSQYYKVFGTCRIPGMKRDKLTFLDRNNPPGHIIVAHNNHLFKVTVGASRPLSEAQILSQLQQVVQKSPLKGPPIGILTSEHRDIWGQAYHLLSCDEPNRRALHEIKTSLFLMCLDGPSPATGAANTQTAAALQMVHGCGSKANAGNRWFDKTIQFVVGTEGGVGLTYEHSPAEGPPIANLMDHVVNYITKGKCNRLPSVDVPPPERLKFNISEEVFSVMDAAEKNIDTLVDDLQMYCFTFKTYGKEFIKTQKLSPDSFIQMAIQYAFFRLHNEPGAHYESASARKFIHGRTETIRSCSNESVDFACSMLNENTTVEDKVKALVKAINAHKQYTIAAIHGLGVDRHLLGLKLIALENGLDIPKLYLDTGYARSSHFRISTSQVAAKCDSFMCYGPLVPDGYACCYNPRANEITFGLSAFRSSPETDAVKFQESLAIALREMHDVLLQAQAKSKL